jgi:hypothetical protein
VYGLAKVQSHGAQLLLGIAPHGGFPKMLAIKGPHFNGMAGMQGCLCCTQCSYMHCYVVRVPIIAIRAGSYQAGNAPFGDKYT